MNNHIRTPAPSAGESYDGFAILGVAFESGHTLCLRQFAEAPGRKGYTSVWMREPNGDWHFLSTVAPKESCAKYMLPELADQTPVTTTWSGESTLTVSIPAISLTWVVDFASTRTTRALSAVAGKLPGWFAGSRTGAKLMSLAASATLGAGRMNLRGPVPNGQVFSGRPARVWRISRSFASIGGYSLGDVVPARPYSFGSFVIPRRGLAMQGSMTFAPAPEAETTLYPFGAAA